MNRKIAFFEGWSWSKFNNLGPTIGTNLKFYTSVAKGLKLKVRKFLGLILTFLEGTGEKLVGKGLLAPNLPSVYNLELQYTISQVDRKGHQFKFSLLLAV